MSGKSSGESSPPQGGSGLAYSNIVRAGTAFLENSLAESVNILNVNTTCFCLATPLLENYPMEISQ